MSHSTGRFAFVLKGYPRLSETFIAQEIRALERRGLEILIFSLRRPTDRQRHPVHDEVQAPVIYLPEYLGDDPERVAIAWRASRRRPGYRAACYVWLRDLRRDPTPNRIRRFGQALVLAHELPADVAHLHAHFLHTPASVTRYASLILGLPWTFSAHAKDIWTTPDWDMREKIASAAWGVVCSAAGAARLNVLAPPGKVELVYHGYDPLRFATNAAAASARDGTRAEDPIRILAVGRAVEKKGFDSLLAALAALPREIAWRLDHIGGGPLLTKLMTRATELGLGAKIEWHGPQAQGAVLALYRKADLFVMPSRISTDGDRDGLPNVLIEAQSQGLACIATEISAIPELVRHGETGWLVPPEDVPALRDSILHLITRPGLRQNLGRAARTLVALDFDFAIGINRLATKFGITGR